MIQNLSRLHALPQNPPSLERIPQPSSRHTSSCLNHSCTSASFRTDTEGKKPLGTDFFRKSRGLPRHTSSVPNMQLTRVLCSRSLPVLVVTVRRSYFIRRLRYWVRCLRACSRTPIVRHLQRIRSCWRIMSCSRGSGTQAGRSVPYMEPGESLLAGLRDILGSGAKAEEADVIICTKSRSCWRRVEPILWIRLEMVG